MGFNIHIPSGRRPSQNLHVRAAVAASFNPPPTSKFRELNSPGVVRPRCAALLHKMANGHARLRTIGTGVRIGRQDRAIVARTRINLLPNRRRLPRCSSLTRLALFPGFSRRSGYSRYSLQTLFPGFSNWSGYPGYSLRTLFSGFSRCAGYPWFSLRTLFSGFSCCSGYPRYSLRTL